MRDRQKGLYLSKVLLLSSSENDPVELRLKLAQHAGFSIVERMIIRESKIFDEKEIVDLALRNNCDQIMIGQKANISAQDLRKLGWSLENTSINLIVAPAVTEIAGPRLQVSNVEGLPLLHLEQPTFSGLARFAKRLMDVIIAIFGLIVISPFLLIISIVIKISDKGSVIYRQKRIGQNNEEFIVYKFRSMYEGTHELREKVIDGQHHQHLSILS